MRSPGVIYRRYRQLKRKLLYDRIVQARKTCHDNCHYGRSINTETEGRGTICFKLCVYGFDPESADSKKPELCTNPSECNAFVNKWTKEKVVQSFEEDLNNWEVKSRKYPELVALEWVLDKDLVEAVKNPGFFAKIVIRFMMFLEDSLVYMSHKQRKKMESK
jgi:hypothetical protein